MHGCFVASVRALLAGDDSILFLSSNYLGQL
jgi:hypothetical protein